MDWHISILVGYAEYREDQTHTIEGMVAFSDLQMYEQKTESTAE